MLRKLLKYDLRANLRIFAFIWPAMLVFAMVDRLVIGLDNGTRASEIAVMLITTLFVFVMIGAFVFTIIITVIRFYGGLLRDEGYLMFTLPAKPWQLILSKILTAMITFVGTTLVCACSVLLLVIGMEDVEFIVSGALTELFARDGVALFAVLLGVLYVISVTVGILQIYFSCAIGHLFRRMRIFFSILAFYAINTTLQTFSMITLMLDTSKYFDALVTINDVNAVLLVAIGLSVLLGAVFFFGSERILHKRLNLE